MKLLTYEPLTQKEALEDFIGHMDELLFEGDASDRRAALVVSSYCKLKELMAREAVAELRNLCRLHGMFPWSSASRARTP